MKRERKYFSALIAIWLLIAASSVAAFPSSVFFFRDKSSPLIELELFTAGFSRADWQAWRELIEELKQAGYRNVEEKKYYEFTYCSCLRFVWEKEIRRIGAEEFIPVGIKIYAFKGVISLKSALKRINKGRNYRRQINYNNALARLAGN